MVRAPSLLVRNLLLAYGEGPDLTCMQIMLQFLVDSVREATANNLEVLCSRGFVHEHVVYSACCLLPRRQPRSRAEDETRQPVEGFQMAIKGLQEFCMYAVQRVMGYTRWYNDGGRFLRSYYAS